MTATGVEQPGAAVDFARADPVFGGGHALGPALAGIPEELPVQGQGAGFVGGENVLELR